ncbi:cytochrome P450 [Streptacidiphilus jiangxiensis]|uniref:Cytochrome P450 n=1 Tax=Streptacidiphilus jiangxiensis TaxID=235985 RepID=A0A1H7I0N5_STRJI|nr:cytochrome P450 [Streptacidiphilus jiangxiensis]SEK56069.1 Cytochrome P450 [Streptacidiphilus jiangxiensis]
MTDKTELCPAGSAVAEAPAAECPHFPLADRPGVGLHREYLDLFRDEPLVPVQMAGGRKALLVTRHADVRTVLADSRFSREAWVNGTLFARKSTSLALVTSDAPTHSRRRSEVQFRFTHRRAEQDRPRIAEIAEELLDRLEAAGRTADLIAEFTTPFPYRVICDMLGVPIADLDRLLPWVTVMMSAGRFSGEEVNSAHETMYAYFFEQVARRRQAIEAGAPGDDLLTSLLTAPEESRLSDEEIVVFGFGIMMAGGETTASHLALCVLQVLRTPGLADSLRRDPSAIPTVVEELLRWVWFAGTGGQPHVTLEPVELAGTVIDAGQVVIPLTDAANRDVRVFDDPDEFRPDRTPNPHLGLGSGRHMCLGAAHARVELQEGLAAILRRLDRLELAVDETELDWRRQMFMRGVWALPVRWRAREDAT